MPRTDPLISDLRRLFGDRVRADSPTLTAYAIDAGIHRITPRAVVLAERREEIPTLLRYAWEREVPVTARSAGTNLTGNAIGPGIILDCSRLNRILEVNREERWARVEPGMIYAELNNSLEPAGLRFAPDPSSGDACKLGGMLGNNAAGPRTLKYGATKDNVLELSLYLADGSEAIARPYSLDDPELHDLYVRHPAFQDLLALVKSHRDLILEKKPRVSKNSSGYNLFALAEGLDRGILDLPRLFVGSEGTLGIVSEAKIRLIHNPARTATGLLYFRRLEEVGEAVNALLPLHPSALEMMDRYAMDLVGRERHGIPSDAQAMLLLELDEGDLDAAIAQAEAACAKFSLARKMEVAREREHQEDLWKARKAIYPTLYRYDARKKPINFADDVVVPAVRITELIRYLEDLFTREGVAAAIYGHIGNGNAHINPLLDLRDPRDINRMIAFSREIHGVVIDRFGGSICGEHGDGRVRAEFVRALYGDELYALFRETKRLLDPRGLLNPGVKLSEAPFTDHLDIERQGKPCVTCGKCNAVCPVYDVLQDEGMSSRGWFHILTSPEYSYREAHRAMEACLNCKSCRSICPAGVDVSELILEKRAEHPNRLAGGVAALQQRPALFERLSKLAGRTQPLWDTPAGRTLIEWASRPLLRSLGPTASLPRSLRLPKLATRTLRERHRSRTEEGGKPAAAGTVAYFHGCAANYFDDGVGDALIRVLLRHGVDLILPRQRCSGTPIQTYGLTDAFYHAVKYNLRSLSRYATVVTGCASCTLALQDYARLPLQGEEREAAQNLAERVFHVSEFLLKHVALQVPELKHSPGEVPVTYHSSCHLRAAGVTREPRLLIQQIPGLRYVEMSDADRCAGGAGTFCLKDPALSQAVFARKRRAVEASGARVVATSCPACMVQLRSGLSEAYEVKHIIQLVAEALSNG
ncbi:MAG: FAD-binding protein [Nitrospirae bacterium]|nr:FAD-binding protein [Nitrospirota bacterium]